MDNLFEIMLAEQKNQELQKIISCNEKTQQFGLVLSLKDVQELMKYKKASLKETHRIEFGESILPKLIYTFCDSSYINQDNYLDILSQLQEIFYYYKNESFDELTDDELIEFMKKQFEEICFGDIEYLRETCLERFTRAIRNGYQNEMQKRLRNEYSLIDSENEYTNFSEETRWEYDLYKTKLDDIFS